MRGRCCALVLLLAVLAGMAACGQGPAEETPTSTGEGSILLQQRCTRCHTLERVEAARKTPVEWEQTVRRMVDRGADLSEAEISVLVDYLSERYR